MWPEHAVRPSSPARSPADPAVTHHHPGTLHVLHLPTPLAVAACLASAAVALFHLARLIHLARLSTVASRSGRGELFVPAEIGHVAVAGGMAVMFAGPHRINSSMPFAIGYLALAGLLLSVVVAHPRCREPSQWACCSLLVVEAVAMACMAAAGRWPVGDLTGWFVAVFAVAGLSAAGGPLVRRVRPARVGAPAITPTTSRLVMTGGMLLMLL